MGKSKLINIPNQLTLLRIICIPFFIASVLYFEAGRVYMRYIPFMVFSLAIITDALDGFFARILDQKTTLGTWLDPIADKMLLIVAFVLLGTINIPELKIPIWLMLIVLTRDFLIISGSLFIHMIKGALFVKPSVFGKITTFLQMITIFTRLLRVPYFVNTLWAITALFTVISGIDYTLKGLKQVHEKN
jgi:cardiolipin synthase (CMP-forming)